jgi:DNA polymerase-1
MLFNNQDFEIKIWNGEKLGSYVCFDTETTIKPFHQIADLVTFQAYGGGDTVYYVPRSLISLFLNKHYESILIAHNATFDLNILSKYLESDAPIYDLLDRNRVRCTNLMYKLLHLASIGYVPFKSNLALLTEKFLGEVLTKDTVRENFGQFLNTPIEEIPQEFLDYGAKDVVATHQLYFSLMGMIQQHDKMNTLLSLDIQAKGDFALSRIYQNGIGFDLAARDEWLIGIDAQMQVQRDILASWGWVRGQKGIKDKYERIIKMLGIDNDLPRTKDGSISSASDDLAPYSSLQFVGAYLKYQQLEKASSFVRDITSSVIHPRYNTLLNTGRTSCSKPNIQQIPRVGGVRELFTPTRKDHVFVDVDYSALELATLAQVTYDRYGESIMRDRINEGECLHYYYATVMHKKPKEEITKAERQMSKAPNFGFSGGLGVDTFITFAKGYDLDLSKQEAQRMKDVWFEAFPEMREYMKDEVGHVYTLTGRKRGRTTFCAEKNTPFQGLASDGFKLALYNLTKNGYNLAAEIHDQVLVEVHKDDAETEMIKIQRIMEDSMSIVCPDVKIGTEGQIVERFCK